MEIATSGSTSFKKLIYEKFSGESKTSNVWEAHDTSKLQCCSHGSLSNNNFDDNESGRQPVVIVRNPYVAAISKFLHHQIWTCSNFDVSVLSPQERVRRGLCIDDLS